MKIYFAHHVSDYGKPRESLGEKVIMKMFPNCTLITPNQSVHKHAYQQIGMAYFEAMVKKCDAIAVAPFPDGEWGMGIWREAEVLHQLGRKVYLINFSLDTLEEIDVLNIRPLSVAETRKRVRLHE